jgi:CRISPR-associated endonuclease/helicase Cas3
MAAASGYWAHSKNERGERHDLVEHLTRVASMAREFAEPFSGGALAEWVGLWHDVGKRNPEWQSYLLAREAKRPHRMVQHAIWGAALAYHILRRVGGRTEEWKDLALPIAGHHAGLGFPDDLSQKIVEFINANPNAVPDMLEFALALAPPPTVPERVAEPTRRELFLRMVFSAVVDADSLDTEAFKDRQKAIARMGVDTGGWKSIEQLCDELDAEQERLMEEARRREADASPSHARLNRIRREIYDACCASALGDPGRIYRLTVPTGGGKTRSGLAFALRHARATDRRRVVIALPYTSIIDQTVDDYRHIFGERAVLEHHSQLDPERIADEDPLRLQYDLAAENWDAPIIVTTTVQLFESLLGRRRTAVRKLHNLAKSVIILDEVQTLPPELLLPTADVLRALVEDYGVTLVLSTATQPALDTTSYLKPLHGVEIHEIVPEYRRHFDELRRVHYAVRPERITWAALANELHGYRQAMVVVNARRDALALINALRERGEADVYHLSTLMCGAHRRERLGEIQRRLALDSDRPVRLVSTQVVEAGVNLDFPHVYRAIGPLDRIVQAAGRCNREWKQHRGEVIIFEPQSGRSPVGPYAAGIEEARVLLRRYGQDRLHDPNLYREYFERLFSVVRLDEYGIQPRRAEMNYPEVARRYRLIRNDTEPVIVPFGDAESRLDEWRQEPTREAWRRLQPFIVNLYTTDVQRLKRWIEPMTDSLYRWRGGYDDQIGLAFALDDPADLVMSPQSLIH